ncbi:hypothetical protein FJZ39_02610 [Candidatus Saccharibacteria bacterium]|nr:hypothetical protein [Candidatus Saccharibacteria bacterium]
MNDTNTVVINGRHYDAKTGMPVDVEQLNLESSALAAPAPSRAATPSVHAPLQQRSQTLRRRHVQKPAAAQAPAKVTEIQKDTPVQKSPHIQRFAPHTPVSQPTPQHVAPSSPTPKPHTTQQVSLKNSKQTSPQSAKQALFAQQARARAVAQLKAQQRAHAEQLAARQSQTSKTATAVPIATAPQPQRNLKPSDVLKKEAIETATASMQKPATRSHRQKKHKTRSSLFARISGFAAASAAVLVLGGYFTYLNMPNLSTRVAASQAGIDASYPGYRPDGYSLNGPVAFTDGSVSMKFSANGSPASYVLTQKRSNWDTLAVADHIKSTADTDASVTKIDGLTLYTYGNSAAWVNKGILHTIEGDAPLSGSQIQRIATSL